jgi:hypothetical protein
MHRSHRADERSYYVAPARQAPILRRNEKAPLAPENAPPHRREFLTLIKSG